MLYEVITLASGLSAIGSGIGGGVVADGRRRHRLAHRGRRPTDGIRAEIDAIHRAGFYTLDASSIFPYSGATRRNNFV